MSLISDSEKIKREKFEFDMINVSVEKQAIEIIDKNPLYYDELKNWFAFDKVNRQWKKVDEVDIIGFIKKTYLLYGLSESKERTTLLNALKDEARYRKPLPLNDFQIQIGKYIYDIRNDDKILATEKYLPNIIIDRDIETVTDKEDCVMIDKLFTEWVEEEKQVLYDIVAYCMSPKYFLDVCFWFVGKGENGKSLFNNVINKVVGFENVTSQDIEILSDPKDRFTKSFLRNKLICSLGDGNPQMLKHTKALKSLTGCAEPIRGEFKGGAQVDFYNKAKLIGCFNTLPETGDKTDGFYRRQHITEFKNNFAGKKNPLPLIKDREFTILAKKSLDILRNIYTDNKIKGWGELEDRKSKYEMLSNPIGLFISQELEEDLDEYEPITLLYKAYNKFAIKKGYNKFDYKDFESRMLLQDGVKKDRKNLYVYGDQFWSYESDIPIEVGSHNTDHKKINIFKGYKIK